MKKSELLETIEEIITEILSEDETVAWGSSNKNKAKQNINKSKLDAEAKREANKQIDDTPSGIISNVPTNESDDDEFDALDDTTSDKESNKSAKEEEKKNKKANKKKDEIISAYKKIAGDIKEKAKAANSGDEEAKAWIDKHQSIIKAYRELQKVG